ncbi:hypothetical protein DSO57_1038825 [Entomophthora muscae]|uniref:Uncharacterized protein n=1 Tax=Entomophthora muscae TaxID=34485 RepID=A0ACC2SYJ3_9FUNG|nr:hypothetical protein DSO57_1038825 [Entomophthora muscae]
MRMINAANKQMYIMLSKIEMFVSEFIPEESIVEEKMAEIDVLLEAAVDKHFGIFETLVKEKIFHFTSDEHVVPFHYEDLLSDNQDHEIEALINELKEEHKKMKQAEMISTRINQIQSKYRNALDEFQDTVDKLKLIDTKINENDMSFLRGNLVCFLDEFRRIFEVYANAVDILKKPPSIQHTHQDLYVQQSTLSTIKDVLCFTKETPFMALRMTTDMKKVKEKPWTDLAKALKD